MKKIILICLSFVCHLAMADLLEVKNFGKNNGNLKMYLFSSQNYKMSVSKVVVVLHGCDQDVQNFSQESAWINIAKKNNLTLIFPAQKKENNKYKCFNWFNKEDVERNKGEISSIIEMIDYVKGNNLLNQKVHTYVTGISAGASMTSALLATYPEYFKAGSIVAGVPFGCASDDRDAWGCMFATSSISFEELYLSIKRISLGYHGEWPRVQIVHGEKDKVVDFANANLHLKQWSYVHNISLEKYLTVDNDIIYKKDYFNSYDHKILSLVNIKEMAHGYPVDLNANCGAIGDYVLDAQFCGAKQASLFFGL